MEQMRISSYCGGFTVYEAMICITAVVITSGLIKVFLLPLLDQLEFVNSADQFKDTLRQAKWLELSKRKYHQIINDSGFFMLQKKMPEAIKQFHREKYLKKSQSVQTAVLHSINSYSYTEALSLSKMKIRA